MQQQKPSVEHKSEYKRVFEFVAVGALIALAAATSFLWYPVAAAAAGIALVGLLFVWVAHEVWTWVYDTQNPVKIHPLKKITGHHTPRKAA